MRDEYVEVLRRGLAERIGISIPTALAGWRQATLLAPVGPRHRWRCRDADDQKFLDLSFAYGAKWLLTRDRDLLSLARRTHIDGLTIVTPATCAGLAA